MELRKNPELAPQYRLIRAEDTPKILHEDQPSLSVFYIGADAARIRELYPYLQISWQASTYPEAVQKIFWEAAPRTDLVMVDLPFQEKQAPILAQALHATTMRGLPVIYNRALGEQMNWSRRVKAGLADEALDFGQLPDYFTALVPLLTKAKQYSLGQSRRARSRQTVSYGFGSNATLKRWMDLALASFFIVLLSPIFLLICLAIMIESRGPVLYNSLRAGRGFRVFTFFKFRTMRVGADRMISSLANLNQYQGGGDATFFKLKDDPRVTRVGAFLRKTSLDELPQLFNVLLGDMSIVGNRPLPLYEASKLTTDKWAERFMGPAGITGLWQIEKRGKPEMSAEERINLDIFYANKNNIWMDLKIIVKTPFSIIQKENV